MSIILKALNEKADNGNMASKLVTLAQEVSSDAIDHLKLVNEQLPEFDTHDATHSEKVIENMDNLIRNDIASELSSYELFLLYMSGYLHDCAMALPTWEMKLLRMTEGREGFTSNELDKVIANDGKPPYKLSKAVNVIEENVELLYGKYENISRFIFIFRNEQELKRDLAERLIHYQQFRNGYIEDLDNKAEEGSITKYLELSDLIRYEYIRITHAKRVEKYIQNLAPLFSDRLGGAWGESLAKDLAKVCRAHGESMEYVKKLEKQASYYQDGAANLQFVAMMLRLADILHFSHDRAPKSLFAEKMINSKESLLHWTAKFEGINYTLDEVDINGRIKIKYMAHCDEPNLYYFIHEYIDWIDNEINNYFRFFHDIENSIQTNHLASKYKLLISEKVDRTQVRYNERIFTPVHNMKFTLNQNKIIKLLMGVGLYKDKYLCLRELYQNSLDACRCMVSVMKSRNENINIKGNIEFGLGKCTENGGTRTYLYCLDNGVGMTKNKIINYFLNIGNSFYNSREFQRQSVIWNNEFKPTSQFGVGILSCFMIGDKLEITTRSLAEDGHSGETIRFSIDGPHENFYYMEPDELDVEKIGQHGTLIKVFLDDNEAILNEAILNQDIKELTYILYGSEISSYREKHNDLYTQWDKHIYMILSKAIALPNEQVDIKVRLASNELEEILPWNTPINLTPAQYREFEDTTYNSTRYKMAGYELFDDYVNDLIRARNFRKREMIKISYKDFEYHFALDLPLPGLPEFNSTILEHYSHIIYNKRAVLVDGISVKEGSIIDKLGETSNLLRHGILNFVGMERPTLSVDRNSITQISKKLEAQLMRLPKLVSERIIKEVQNHINEYNLAINSFEVKTLWKDIFTKFQYISQDLINHIQSNLEADMALTDLSIYLEKDITLNKFMDLNKLKIAQLDWEEFSSATELVLFEKLCKAHSVQVTDNDVVIESESLSKLEMSTMPLLGRRRGEKIPLAIKSDIWNGKYAEYDLVSSLWPIVSPNLYMRLIEKSEAIEFTDRVKFIDSHFRLTSIARLHPGWIHPKLGIFTSRMAVNKKSNSIRRFEQKLYVSKFDNLDKGEDLLSNEKKEYLLYVYISPRALNESEKKLFSELKEQDPEYCEGIEKGWSILFLANRDQQVIVPGVVPREKMVQLINPSFWDNNDITYMFTDGTVVQKTQVLH